MEKVCLSQGVGVTMGNRVLHKSRSWHSAAARRKGGSCKEAENIRVEGQTAWASWEQFTRLAGA